MEKKKRIMEYMPFDLEKFMDVANENTREFRELMSYYRCAIMEVETKFRVLNEQMAIDGERNPIEMIKSRVKAPKSIIEKLSRKNLSLDPATIAQVVEENLFDVAGVRVTCSFTEDIYSLTDCFLQQDDIVLVERKDYIKNPKPSGYRSLHLIVEVPIFLREEKRNMKVEVQLRTIAMDFWASLEHKLRYKKNIDPALMEELSSELVDCAEKSALLDEKMLNIRRRISQGR